MTKRYKKNYNVDGWPILDTETNGLLHKDDLVILLNKHEEEVAVLKAEYELLKNSHKNDIEHLLAKNDELKSQVNELLIALDTAKNTFSHYAKLHAQKGTADGDAKAYRNTELAEYLEAVSKFTPQQCLALHNTKFIKLAVTQVPAHGAYEEFGHFLTDTDLIDYAKTQLALCQPY